MPELVKQAVSRIGRGESVDAAVSWAWFTCATTPLREAVDRWLVETRHPLAMVAGTSEGRFRAIVAELAS
jgi:hypothetical protein